MIQCYGKTNLSSLGRYAWRFLNAETNADTFCQKSYEKNDFLSLEMCTGRPLNNNGIHLTRHVWHNVVSICLYIAFSVDRTADSSEMFMFYFNLIEYQIDVIISFSTILVYCFAYTSHIV